MKKTWSVQAAYNEFDRAEHMCILTGEKEELGKLGNGSTRKSLYPEGDAWLLNDTKLGSVLFTKQRFY